LLPNFFKASPFRPCSQALIAGQGLMPHLILSQMKLEGIEPLVICLEESNYQALKSQVRCIYRVHPIEISKAINLLRKHLCCSLTFAGRVPHQLLLQIRPWHLSWTVWKLWQSLKDTRVNTVLTAIIDLLESQGFKVLNSLNYLSNYVLTGSPAKREDRDVLLGIAAAKILGALDIGQSVITHKGSVLAVEGIEGTDRCIDRVIEMGIKGAVLVKMAKPNQDLRFDIPVVGDTTFKRLVKGSFRALVIEEGITICSSLNSQKHLKALGIQVLVADSNLIEKALRLYGNHLRAILKD
jgi:DUF1009 family protein